MELVNKVILDSMVRLVRQVPWGPSRDKLLSMSDKFEAEGRLEHGWDNYSTAAGLWWEAGLYKLAAEARFPREGDNQVAAMRDALLHRLVREVSMHEDDDDVGEVTRKNRWSLSMALAPSVGEDTIEVLVDELAEAGLLDDSPEYLKSLHAAEAAENAQPTQPSAQLRL
ncbi:hypothetical protein OIU34_23025 [Pararhizobium sp. BT-229]|uniref:hypothetical protein n=1 Tax=Pararhizobium sp. BT-229 TaxID=2986923 RepID=UPI0021F7BE35|nr:hypothetical protein [Pararhizobium sp. BT-229]MCV9964768.1 hypothetical protein [Pararhizobium sp. BT-229]